ncbi:MAG: energy-dependent translational throttle protein EttA [Rickettsia endosymbiont of Argas persicus]
MSSQYVYEMGKLSKNINGKQILKETNLSFLPKAKIGIIGHNGAGKSTLLKIMAGIDKDYDGSAGAALGIKVGYLPQEPHLNPDKNVFENIMEGLHEKKKLIDEFNYITNKFTEELTEEQLNELFVKQAELQEKIDSCDGWNLERKVEIAMLALRCPPKEANVTKISGGEKRRVALCKILLEKPDMLLLDEPTNHLDAESVSWLENYLKAYDDGTVIVITHDRYFLDNVTEWILEIDRGNCIPWKSNYSSWLEQKQTKLALESKEEDDRKKQLSRELEWIRQAPKARQSKSKARITAYQELLNKQQAQKIDPTQIIVPNGPHLGDLVIEAEHIAKKYNDKILLSDFSFKVPRGAIVGIIGPNGAGKTTLFNIITGKVKPDSGSIKIGPTVKLGCVDQSRDHLNDNKTVWEEIAEGLDELRLGNNIVKSRAYCAAFNFRGGDQQKKVGQLSGGERNRVHLAKLLKEGANVILLDEPSNDLDLDTLRALEDAILDFAGCVLVISHDRWFLDRIATHIIAYDTEGNATWFEGNYQDYHEYMLKIKGENVLNPKYKHKKLV